MNSGYIRLALCTAMLTYRDHPSNSRLDLCKMAALIGFMPEDLDLSVVCKVNPQTSTFGPAKPVTAAWPLPWKALQRPKLNSRIAKMDLAMSVMSLRNLENTPLESDSMILIFP